MANQFQARLKIPTVLQKFALPLLAVAMFFGVCLSSAETVKGSAVFFILLALVGGAANFKRLRERFSLPMMALGLFVMMCGISTFYAVAGKFALQEFLKLLISFCLATFMLAAAPGKDTTPERRIASVLEGFTAIAGVVSIDMISTRLLSGAVTGLLQLFSADTEFHNFFRPQLPKLYQAFTLDHNKLFMFGMMPVVPLCDSGF